MSSIEPAEQGGTGRKPGFPGLEDAPLILDGGFATQLESRGHDLSGELWSAQLLLSEPAEIVAAHRDFFDAGAQVATTASYQLSREGLGRVGRADDFESLLRLSVDLAREAAGEEDLVAASVGPYGAMLADGSEYRGDYGLSVAQLAQWHRPRLEILAEAGAEVLAIETVPNAAEAEALLALVAELGVPAWLSLSVAEGRTRAGEELTEIFRAAGEVENLVAVGINCSSAAGLAPVLSQAVAVSGKPAIAYPNSGEDWLADAREWSGEGRFDATGAQSWVNAGARWVGGCCRVGPALIAEVARAVG